MQTEYSTDLVFNSEAALKPIYEQLSRQAVIAVKAENVSSFRHPSFLGLHFLQLQI
jgi:hypothetical protein